MRITVFGAAGNVGSRVVAEALSRGHEVTAVVRDPARFHELHADANVRVGDAGSVVDVVELSAGQDAVTSATRPASGRESELVTTTKVLMDGLARTGVRLLLVGGAARLTVPDSGGTALIDDPQPRYMDQLSFNDGGEVRFTFRRAGEPEPPKEINPNSGEPTCRERFLRRQTMGWGIASLVLGSTVLVGGLLTKTP